MIGAMTYGMHVVPTKAVPRKEHYWKPGMKMSYHRRIHKKWLKRYGTKQVKAYIIAETAGF